MQEISKIKAIRKRIGVTQLELAKLSGVSQSLIAKVEAGLLDPTYSNAKKIFAAIDSLSNKVSPKIEDLMIKKIVYSAPDESIKKAISKMKQHQISQMPVIKNGQAVGLISENVLLNAVMDGKVSESLVEEVMREEPPVLSINSSFDAVSYLLKFYPLVLVSNKGKLSGIITKADLLTIILNK